jgi:hypothetical protein
MQTSETIGALVAAIAKSQAQIKNPPLDSVNPHFKNRYASLGAHLDAIRGPFAANGLILSQSVENTQNGVAVTTMIAHASGEWMRATVAMPLPERATAQNLGACVSYLRRYAIASIAMLTGEEDDDAEGDRKSRQEAPAPAPASKPTRAQAAASRDALFGAEPRTPAPRTRERIAAWPADGEEVVTIRQTREREGGVIAAFCEHPEHGCAWVQFAAEMAEAAQEGRRVTLSWEYSDAGFVRAVEVRGAPRLTEMEAK